MPPAIVAIVLQVLGMLPQLMAAAVNVVPMIEAVIKALQSGSTDPTDAQWQAVDDIIKANTAIINADPPAASAG